MAVLEQITQMKNQGIPENQIIESLRQQGVSPKQITDALSQSQIKSAVAGEPPAPQAEGMQPSIMNQGTPPVPGQEVAPPLPPPPGQTYSAQTQEVPQGVPAQAEQYQAPTQTYTDQGYYPQEGYYDDYSQGSTGTDTIIEVSEQVFSEKSQKMQKQIREISEFKTIAETKIEIMDERLKRIEKSIDNLQTELLGKVGSYSDTLSGIEKEMSMMQDSFGKTMKKMSSPTKRTRKKTSKKK